MQIFHVLKKTSTQITVLVFIYLMLTIPLLGKAFWHDEIYASFSYLKAAPFIDNNVKLDTDRYVPVWREDYKRVISFDPPMFLSVYYLWIRVFGDSEISLHIVSMINSLAALILVYFLGKLVFNKRVSFFASMALVFSPAFLMYSVQANTMSFEIIYFVLSLFLLSKLLISQKRKYFYLLLAANLLGLYSFYHYVFYLCLQVLFLWIKRRELKVNVMYLVASCCVIGAFFLFFIYNQVSEKYSNREYWQKNNIKSLAHNMVFLPKENIK